MDRTGTKLFLVVNVEWSFLSHRLPIALEALKRKYEVTILAVEEEGRGDEIRSYGLKFIPLPTTRGGKNPITELKLIRFLYQIYKREQPDIVHHVAIKPVLLGSIAAKFAGQKKVVNAIAGFGSMFIGEGLKTVILKNIIQRLFRFSFNNDDVTMIVQNVDDEQEVLSLGVLKKEQVKLIRGSGVDVHKFSYSQEPESTPIRVVLPARILWDKGVAEYAAAARILVDKYPGQAKFILAGKLDKENITGVPEEKLQQWNKEGLVEWIGHQNDIVKMFKDAHIVVLPSYREGLPKALIEASAIGRPIVTTDVPGCREVLDEGGNGFLAKVKDVNTLANAIEKLIVSKELRVKMGKAARKKAVEEFSIDMVIDATFQIYES